MRLNTFRLGSLVIIDAKQEQFVYDSRNGKMQVSDYDDMFIDTDQACMRTCKKNADCKINTVDRNFDCVEGCCTGHGRRANLHTLTNLWLLGYLGGAAQLGGKRCKVEANQLLEDLLQLRLDEFGAIAATEDMLSGCAMD